MSGRTPFRLLCAALVGTACLSPPGPLPKNGQIEGTAQVSPGLRGDAWVFLYQPGQGPPQQQALPLLATAVSDVRLASGDAHYVLANVPPNPYRLWGFLDTNRNFQPTIDVLAQPGAGDRIGAGVELNLQPGEDLSIDLSITAPVPLEPPAFQIPGSAPFVLLPDQPVVLLGFGLSATSLGVLSDSSKAFSVSLADANDPNAFGAGTGLPAMYPQVFFRFLPKPGQTVPLDPKGNPAQVVVPLFFNPGPFLLQLNGDPSRSVSATDLQVFLLPQAQAVMDEPGRGRVTTALGAIPVGDYELWVVQKSGQFWRLPNDLGTAAGAAVGGPFASQAVHFRFAHGTGLDAGP